MTMIIGLGDSPMMDVGQPERFAWEWFSGQGAFKQFSDRLLNVQCPVEADRQQRDGEWEEIRAYFKETWTYHAINIATKMRHPSARAVILNHYWNQVRVSIWLIYPGMHTVPEPQMCCWSSGDATNQCDYFEERLFMKQMKPKFWEPDFSHFEMSKRPLPALPIRVSTPRMPGRRPLPPIPTERPRALS